MLCLALKQNLSKFIELCASVPKTNEQYDKRTNYFKLYKAGICLTADVQNISNLAM